MDMATLSIRAFYDRMNKLVEKTSKEALAGEEVKVLAEFTGESRQVGANSLCTVQDFEGRQMLWMVPSGDMNKALPGTVALAKGTMVLWPSLKKGKRLEWLQVKSLTIPVETAALSRQRKRLELAQGGVLSHRPNADWPVTTNRSGIQVHLVAHAKEESLTQVRDLFKKGKRFVVTIHAVNMNDPAQVAEAINKVSRVHPEFCLLIQGDEDNPLVFDDERVLRALQKGTGYTYLIQPQAKVRPFAYFQVNQWGEDPLDSAREIVIRCWQLWKSLREKERVKEALVEEAGRDRVRFAAELSRLKQESQNLREKLATQSPQRVLELEEQVEKLEQQLAKSEERRKVALNQLFSVEQENQALQRNLALLEDGQEGVALPDVPMEEAVRRAVVGEEFKRSLVEEERDRLIEERDKLKKSLDHYNLLSVDSLEQEVGQHLAELDKSENRRELLSEMLFLLEQENRELKGRLGFREDLEVQGDVTGLKGKGKLAEEALVVGKARLISEIRDLLIKEEMERLQRENKRLRTLMESVSPAAIQAVQERLEDTESKLHESEHRQAVLTKELETLHAELGQVRQQAGQEALGRMEKYQQVEEAPETDSMDLLMDKAVSFFRRIGKKGS